MENQFVPYEQALALKELGFDEPCMCYYSNDVLYQMGQPFSFNEEPQFGIFYPKSNIGNDLIAAPLYQQAFKWFRDNHNLYHRIDPSANGLIDIKDISYTIFDEYDEIYEDSCYWSYEQAELNRLKKLIELKSK